MPPRNAACPRPSTISTRSYPASHNRSSSARGAVSTPVCSSMRCRKKASFGATRCISAAMLATTTPGCPVANCISARTRSPARSPDAFITRTSGVSRCSNCDAATPSASASARMRTAAVSVEVTSRTVRGAPVPAADSAAAICDLCASGSPKAATGPLPAASVAAARARSGAVNSASSKGCFTDAPFYSLLCIYACRPRFFVYK